MLFSFRFRLKGHDGSLDDIDTFIQLMLSDDEGWGQADDVAMSGFGQQTIVAKTQANLPSIVVWGDVGNV